MKLRSLYFGIALLGLAGCAVGPDFQAPRMATPGHFSVTGAALTEQAPPDAWWRAFHDAQLDALVLDALAHNPDVAAAAAHIRQARAERDALSGSDLPQVEASARESRDNLSLNSEGFSNIPTAVVPHPQHEFNDYRIGLDASWEIDLFGYNRRSVEAATARLDSAAERAHAAVLEVAAEVALDYIDLRATQQRAALAIQNAELARDQLRLTRLARRAGLASDLDIERDESALRAAEARIPLFEAQVRADMNALTLLLGQAPGTLDARLAAPGEVPAVPPVVGVGLPSDLLQRRPDVRGALQDLAAANADVGVAVAAQYPRFSLVSSLGYDSIHPGQLTSQASRFWGFGPQVSLPLFSGFQLQNQVKANQAAYDAALQGYRKAVLNALSDSETALIRFDRETSRLTQLDAARQSAGRSLDLTRKRVAVGEVGETDALQADVAVVQATDQWTQSQAARAADLVGLFKALGGGWRAVP